MSATTCAGMWRAGGRGHAFGEFRGSFIVQKYVAVTYNGVLALKPLSPAVPPDPCTTRGRVSSCMSMQEK